ncbi:hypothetical protein, partial [Modestobacter sp. DSM 44400]|uniref:hypothetical protein n=1 Tax=Modestobacter sp. DSM 44400 TaxID=1550230 RepID=UPI001C31E234
GPHRHLGAAATPAPAAELALAGRLRPAVHRHRGAEKKALRAAQVYMDDVTDDHLRRIKAAALVEGADVTGSAIVRRAVAELVERHGHDGIVRLIQDDPIVQRGKGRPRR